jgi:hypothetical protein
MRNFDYPAPQQGRMVKQQLARMVMDATALYQTLGDDDRLPAWTLLKINTAEDRLHVASDYLRYKARPALNAYGADDASPKGSYTRDFLLLAAGLVVGVTVLDVMKRRSA